MLDRFKTRREQQEYERKLDELEKEFWAMPTPQQIAAKMRAEKIREQELDNLKRYLT